MQLKLWLIQLVQLKLWLIQLVKLKLWLMQLEHAMAPDSSGYGLCSSGYSIHSSGYRLAWMRSAGYTIARPTQAIAPYVQLRLYSSRAARAMELVQLRRETESARDSVATC